jgi:hypothetical protein
MINNEHDKKTLLEKIARWEDAVYSAFQLLGMKPIDPDGEKLRDMLATRYGVDEADIETAYFRAFNRQRDRLASKTLD